MSERRVIEVLYTDFSTHLRNATNTKKKIEKTNKEAWANYVKKHNVPEPALLSRGKAGTLSGKVDLVIIDGAGESDGYYVYSSAEDFCLKFESGVK
jgi:hypothetical protein